MSSAKALVFAGAGLFALAAAGRPALAQDDPQARIDALQAKVDALARELAELKGELRARPVATAQPPSATQSSGGAAPAPGGRESAPPSPPAIASASGGKVSIRSADGRFAADFHGVMQFDAAQYMQATPGPVATDLRRGATPSDTAHARDLSSGTDLRRARIGMDGRMFGDFEYNVLLDFGGSGLEDAGHVHELWLQYSGLKPFHLRAGAFAPSIGLEDQGSTNGMPLLERPAISDIARSLAGGDFREAVQLSAAGDRWFASAAVTGRLVGVVNSSGSGVSQPYDSQLGYVGRVAFVPFNGEDWLLHLGAHGSYVARPADARGPDAAASAARYAIELRERPELRVDGTRLIDTGAIDAAHASSVGLEAAAQKQNLFVQAEYEHLGIERRNSRLSNPGFDGWYVEGSWILTGEARRYNRSNFAFDAPPVAHDFDLKAGTWGAWELALRYSEANLNHRQGLLGAAPDPDAVRGGDQTIFTAGLNWYLNPVVRLMFDYQHVKVDRLSPNAVAFDTPIGAQIGQSYDTLAMRSQLAF